MNVKFISLILLILCSKSLQFEMKDRTNSFTKRNNFFSCKDTTDTCYIGKCKNDECDPSSDKCLGEYSVLEDIMDDQKCKGKLLDNPDKTSKYSKVRPIGARTSNVRQCCDWNCLLWDVFDYRR